jgi:hypothetical protein
VCRHIRLGDKEPIEAVAVDALNNRLSSLTNLKLQVRRTSDNLYLDWTDSTFKASPTQLWQTLSEVDDTDSEGEYNLDVPGSHEGGFDTSLLVNPASEDTYRMLVVQDGSPQNADNMPQIGHLKVGGFIDYIDEAISSQASPSEVTTALRDFGLDHLVSVNPGVVPPTSNTYIRQILDNQTTLLDNQTNVYSIQQNWSYRQSDDTLQGQIWVESGNLVVVAPTTCSVTWYDHPTGASLFTIAEADPDARGVFALSRTAPGFLSNRPYYAEASVNITGYGTIKGIKGVFVLG